MNATVVRSAHPWAATHRRLLALVAVAIAVAATVVIVLMTSAGPSPSSSVQAPAHGQIAPRIPGPADPRAPQQPDIPTRCLQHMGLQYMALVPC
jgi:hypothetical protein